MNTGRSFKKNKNRDDPDQNSVGDLWVYTVVKSDSGLFVAHCSGKRTDTTCNLFLNLVFERFRLPSPTEKILIITDDNPQYANTLVDLYCEPCTDDGQVIMKLKNNRLVDVIQTKIMRYPEIDSISTSVVEGYNNMIRQTISRYNGFFIFVGRREIWQYYRSSYFHSCLFEKANSC